MGRATSVGRRTGGAPTPPPTRFPDEASSGHRVVQVGRSRGPELAVEAFQADGEVDVRSIDPDALEALAEFWEDNPDILRAATERCGVDPTEDPVGYFRVGLAEDEHQDIAQAVEAAEGVLSLTLAQRWMNEERAQNADTDDDEEYRSLLALAAGPLPDLDDTDYDRYRLERTQAELDDGTPLGSDLARTLAELQASGDIQNGEAVRVALEAVGAAHRQTLDAVREVLTAGVQRADGRSSDTLTLAALGVLDSFARQPAPRQPDIHVHTPKQDLTVHVDAPEVRPEFHIEAPAAPDVKVDVTVPEREQPIVVNVPAPVVQAAAPPVVNVTVPEAKPQPARNVRVEYDDAGFKHFIVEETAAPDPVE